MLVEVSVDGKEFFGGPGEGPIFHYIADPEFSSSQESISPSRIGTTNAVTITITGNGFPSHLKLPVGFPQCRFEFSRTSVAILRRGRIVDSAHVECQSPAGPSDPTVTVGLSYDGVLFHKVLTSQPLQFLDSPLVVQVEPPYGFADSSLDLTVSGARLGGADLVRYSGIGPQREDAELPISSATAA